MDGQKNGEALLADGLSYQKAACALDIHNEGFHRNYVKAAECFRIATEMGNIEAQTELGACYLVGNGVERDRTKGFELCQKSAAQGNALAMFFIGNCYCEDENWLKAVEWYGKSKEYGYPHTKYPLEYCIKQLAASL